MIILKRSFLYIYRKKAKSFLLIMIMFTCLLCVLVASAVHNRTSEVTMELKEKLSGYFTIIPDLMVEGSDERLTDEFCREIMKQENVLAYNGTGTYTMTLPDVKLTAGIFSGDPSSIAAQTVTFISSTDSYYNEQFYLGELNVTDGNHLKPQDEWQILVSETFAQENALAIGDEICGVVTEGNQGTNNDAIGQKFIYKIKGIYHIKNPEDGNIERAETEILENQIYVCSKTGNEIVRLFRSGKPTGYQFGVNIYVKDSKEFDHTVTQIQKEMNLDEVAYRIERNNAKYLNSAEPLERIIGMTEAFILIVIVLNAMILYLILNMWMKDRRREMGIYLAVGIEKKMILGQLLIEGLVLYMGAFLAALLGASGMMKMVEKVLFSKESFQKYEELGVIISGTIVGQVAVIGLIITVLAVVIAFINVAKMKPREILASNE